MLKDSTLIVVRAVFGVLTLAALVTQLRVHIGMGAPVLNFFSFFTILSNLFAGLVLLYGVWQLLSFQPPPAWYEPIRGAAVVYMVVVGVVFVTLLRNTDLGGLRPWVNTVHHYVMPVVMVLEWLLRPPARRLDASALLPCLAFPVIYLVYTLLRGASTSWYPYPFLNPANVGGYGVVALYILGMIAVFLLAGWFLILRVGSRGTARAAAHR